MSNAKFGSVTRRHLVGGLVPSVGFVAAAAQAVTAERPTQPRVGSIVNVADFGAEGNGKTDNGNAFRAALATAQVVEIPSGSFLIGEPLVLRDGQVIRGTGRSGWDPYLETLDSQAIPHTEIVLDGHLGFDARNTSNVCVSGLAIRAARGKHSPWGSAPGYQPSTAGIDIAGAYQFQATDISFHGLESGVIAVAEGGRSAQMPHFGNWVAHDCDVVFRFASQQPDFQSVRDARIEGCLGALHCGTIVDVRNCDGLRIENVRFYQCSRNSVLVENTPFVSIIGATLFETTLETIVLRSCTYITIAGAQFARAGYFRKGPLLQQAGMVLEKCADVAFSGLIEQPIGRAITITGCTNVSIQGAMGMPYWTTGNLAAQDGAIRIEQSRAVTIQASFSGEGYWAAVWCDSASAASTSGQIATEGAVGVVRCASLQPAPLGHISRNASEKLIAPHTLYPLDTLRVLIPPGKSLVTRAVEVTAAEFVFVADSQHWQPTTEEAGGGTISIVRKVLDHNDSTIPRYSSIKVGVYNTSDQPRLLPAGHELRLSLAFE